MDIKNIQLLLLVIFFITIQCVYPMGSCPNCANSIQNCSETGVDCGGADCITCAARCSNGVLDGDEIGIDCGGADCLTCGPSFVWAKSMGGTSSEYGTSIAVDGSGNVYTTGTFRGTADFDPGAGVYNLTPAGSSDIFVSKLDASGNFVWAKGMGGTNDDRGQSIAVDGSGNVYTAGFFQSTVDFDPGAGTYNLTAVGGYDIYVSKLDGSGNFVWVKSMGGLNNNQGQSIALDGLGNVYTSGTFYGTADFDPGAGTYNLTAVGGYDIYVSKLDGSGNFVWARNMGGTSSESGYSIALDVLGNLYITGYFQGTADFDPGVGTYNLTSAGLSDIFVSKLDGAGNFVWARSMEGTSSNYGRSIALDGLGNVYTTGIFKGTTDFDPSAGTYNLTGIGFGDIFVSKLDGSGNFVWAKRISGTSVDYANSIATDASFFYIMGDFYSATVDFDPGAGTYNLTNTGTEANFVGKYDYDGNFICAFSITPGHNETDRNRHLAVDGTGNVYITAGFNDPAADFDPCPPVYNAPTYGNHDIYVAKYDMSVCDCSPLAPLPIMMLSFSGKNMGEYNLLQWATALEINNDYFIIERSEDGENFESIGMVNGAGNSNTASSYSYIDKNLHTGLSYYRLKQIDYDGQFSYSRTIAVNVANEQSIQLFDLYGREISKGQLLLNPGIYIQTDGNSYKKVLKGIRE